MKTAVKRLWSLAQLMALPFNPVQMLGLAHRTGCAATGIRMLPTTPGGVHYPLMTDRPLLRETLACMQDTGVRILDLEIIRIGAGFRVQDCLPFLETGAQLGAAHINVAADDTDPARLTAGFAALCEAAAQYGMHANLEFMPWTAVPDVATARKVVDGAAQGNAAILVDVLHFFRCGSTLQELAALPRTRLHYAQICDGQVPGPTTVDGLIFDARCQRLPPGMGGMDVRAMFDQLPPDLTVSVEVPNDARVAEFGHEAWSRQAVQAARAVLGET